MNSIDWEQLAKSVGAISEGGESGSNRFAWKAIENLIGEENIKEAVEHYIGGGPGSELARFVIWQIHPWSAMEYCYEIYKTDSDLENRRAAVELLRVAADDRVVPWIRDFLEDQDIAIRAWGFGVVDQLLWSELVEEDDVLELIELAEKSADENLQENINFVKGYLSSRKEQNRILDEHHQRDA